MKSTTILAAIFLVVVAKASGQNCGSVFKTFHECMHSTSSDSGSSTDVAGAEQKLRTCFTNAGCSHPTITGASDDEEDGETATRPGESIAVAVEKCTNKLKEEDIYPRLQSCMEGKVSGWQFPTATHQSTGHGHSANNILLLKRKYGQGIQNMCPTREARVEGRKCLKTVRTGAAKGHRGAARKQAGEGDPMKREQCMQKVSQDCRATLESAQQNICQCASEHLKEQSIHAQLGNKLSTCVRTELRSMDMSEQQTRKMERAIRKAGQQLIQKCKGRGGRRRGGQGQRRQQRVRPDDEE